MVEPEYLKAIYKYNSYDQTDEYSHYVYTLVPMAASTLPPILNAMEVYWDMDMDTTGMTSANDGNKSFFFQCT
jgi:Malectin-like domain